MVSRIFYATLTTSCLFILLQTGQILEVLAVEFPATEERGAPPTSGSGRGEILRDFEDQTETNLEEENSQDSASDEKSPVSPPPPPTTQSSEGENNPLAAPLPQGEGTTLREEDESLGERQRDSSAEDNPLRDLLESGRAEGEVLRDEEQHQIQQQRLRQREVEVNDWPEDNTPSSPTPEQVSGDEGEGTILQDSSPAW